MPYELIGGLVVNVVLPLGFLWVIYYYFDGRMSTPSVRYPAPKSYPGDHKLGRSVLWHRPGPTPNLDPSDPNCFDYAPKDYFNGGEVKHCKPPQTKCTCKRCRPSYTFTLDEYTEANLKAFIPGRYLRDSNPGHLPEDYCGFPGIPGEPDRPNPYPQLNWPSLAQTKPTMNVTIAKPESERVTLSDLEPGQVFKFRNTSEILVSQHIGSRTGPAYGFRALDHTELQTTNTDYTVVLLRITDITLEEVA